MGRLPPTEKFSMAVRKDLRDEWETKKDDFEKMISDTLGESWKIDIDPKAIYPYAVDDFAQRSPGGMLAAYMNGIKYQLDRFIEKHGESGKKEINTICKAHTITMDLDVDQKVNYNGCKVSSDGELVIIFAEGYLGTNVDDTIAEEKFAPALNDAPTASLASPMSFHARRSINIEYNPHIELIQKRLDDLLQFNVQLEPCFEEVFAKMKAAKSPEPRWEVQFGFFMKEYFEGFVYKLETLKFGEDEMLREGFTEAVEKRAVAFRVVDASNMKKAYNECVLEDGILYLQTVPEYFGANVGDCAVDVLDVL